MYVIDFVKRIANEKQTKATWLDHIMRAAFHLMRKDLFAVVPQPHANAFAQSFHSQRDQLIVAQTVSVSDNVRACFVDAEHHQQPLSFGEWIAIEKIPHAVAQQSKVRGMTAELD